MPHLFKSTSLSLLAILSLSLLTFKLIAAVDKSTVEERIWHQKWTNKYDKHFRKQAKHYFGINFDWRWFKAQAIAESSLRQKAKSRTGAIGLMQIQPTTYKEIRQKNKHFKDISSPRWNIAAGIYYDRKLYKRWKEKGIPPRDRLDFSLAAYNAGFVGVLRAIRRSPNKTENEAFVRVSWPSVEAFVPRETSGYVNRINRLMGRPVDTASNKKELKTNKG